MGTIGLLWIIFGLSLTGYFFGRLLLLTLIPENWWDKKIVKTLLFLPSVCGIIAIVSLLLVLFQTEKTNTDKANTEKQTAIQFELEIKYDQEAAIAKEWETTKKLPGGKAWWLNLTPAELKTECNAIAGRMGYDPQALFILLAKQNCLLTWAPAGQEPRP